MTAAVKMFYQGGAAHLDEKLNAWLDEMAGQVVIRALTMGGDMYGPCLTVVYEPGGGLPAFAAQSAEYGHCLCLINTVS